MHHALRQIRDHPSYKRRSSSLTVRDLLPRIRPPHLIAPPRETEDCKLRHNPRNRERMNEQADLTEAPAGYSKLELARRRLRAWLAERSLQLPLARSVRG